MNIIDKIIGTESQRQIKKWKPLVDRINSLEKKTKKLTDTEFKLKTEEFKKRLSEGEDIDNILPEAFALVREASVRTRGERHYDVQLIGAIALHNGKVTEMRTGEGKTLAATTPAYLNALLGKGVHIVTVNDYLAKRDAVWMGQIYYALGLSVACILHETAFIYDPNYKSTDENNQDEQRDIVGGFRVVENYLRPITRKEAYQADITYGTNHEFGFDYLRDNLVYDLESKVQRGHYFCIVDEVDSILIDEARTPLIITIPEAESSEYYKLFAKIVPGLKKEEDYNLDEKMRSVTLTEEGIHKVE